MIQRVLEQQQPLCATVLELKKGDLMPTDVEFSNMELFVQVMKSIVEINEALKVQKYVAISMVRLCNILWGVMAKRGRTR